MNLYRLSKDRWKQDLSGKGAEMTGNRWNSRGVAMVYTAESRALAHAEITVHLNLEDLPTDYWMLQLWVPDDAPMQVLSEKDLPADWRSWPHPASTQAIGDAFIRHNQYLFLKVPSAVVDGDYNYLLNPSHHRMLEVTIAEMKPFRFDQRLSQSR
ncbi:RES domain-containing protein [Cnuella takakiae]|uniref:RES domain-containing protein n=1 Tax=Cnuella takakiae TaxID=1302690 RepID=A0A1M5AX72_9BACT|nr:RES family NAD+ phosphorylase [Cnuella takakiae]OLY93255.1 RES superfamily protein [Cnuella takakiae]SHF34810.1 RES domain-containing protein [Cnuella takakiae]